MAKKKSSKKSEGLSSNAKIGILVLIVVVIAIVSSLVTYHNATNVVRIGAIYDLTGAAKYYGEWGFNGMSLAVSEINEAGGINGKKLEVIVEDGACDQKDGIAAAQKLIGIDGVPVIIGPTCSSVSMAVAPVAEENQVVMFTPISSVPALRHAGDYIFRNKVGGDTHGRMIAEFMFNDKGHRKAAVLYINLDNGVGYKDAFTETFEGLGGEVVASEAYEKGVADFRSQLIKFKSQNPQAILIAGQESENAILQLRQIGMNQPIYGVQTMLHPDVINVGRDAAEGVIFSYSSFNPESSDPHVADFQTKLRERFGDVGDVHAANAYDATYMIRDALLHCGESSDCIRDFLYQIRGYPGVGGITSFDSDGEVSKPLILKTVVDGEFVDYKG